jgi:hypothetical protein
MHMKSRKTTTPARRASTGPATRSATRSAKSTKSAKGAKNGKNAKNAKNAKSAKSAKSAKERPTTRKAKAKPTAKSVKAQSAMAKPAMRKAKAKRTPANGATGSEHDRKPMPETRKSGSSARRKAAATRPPGAEPEEPQGATSRAAEVVAGDRDPSDDARDARLRDELLEEAGRSPLDRHRERLTPVEAEDEGVKEQDDAEAEAEVRQQALDEQEVPDERLERP